MSYFLKLAKYAGILDRMGLERSADTIDSYLSKVGSVTDGQTAVFTTIDSMLGILSGLNAQGVGVRVPVENLAAKLNAMKSVARKTFVEKRPPLQLQHAAADFNRALLELARSENKELVELLYPQLKPLIEMSRFIAGLDEKELY